MEPLQLWGGAECTVNRTHAGYADQTHLSGHHERDDDLDLFADLGLAAIRYPVLWERHAADANAAPDWRWSDRRLVRLRDLGVAPIAGLVHHGSGPAHTHLLDDGFAPGLGAYAGLVAERYPWIERWTPVNEPLTTARFTALYGHWYPHARDEAAFWRALLNQIDGTRAAMRAIRRVNPAAQLVQTDDLGRTYATLRLAEQAAFDNLRRWASWDLLFGRVTPHHPLWQRIARYGLGDRLRAIADDPCPPDILGVNHYLTSDRFLDHRLPLYPPHLHGGSDRQRYADTEAIRVLDPAPQGLAGALREAWQRYRTPIAVTEVHNGCTREEQLRWVAEAWDTAIALRGEGVHLTAVTAWSLLGSHNWNTLLTGPGTYETGVFDVAAGTPRPTALAALWRGLPHDAPRHPAADGPGWWRRDDRFAHRPVRHASTPSRPLPPTDLAVLRIQGADTPLGMAVAAACDARALKSSPARGRWHAQHDGGGGERRPLTRPALSFPPPTPMHRQPARAEEDQHVWATIDATGDTLILHAADAEHPLVIHSVTIGPATIDTALDLLIDGQTGVVHLPPRDISLPIPQPARAILTH